MNNTSNTKGREFMKTLRIALAVAMVSLVALAFGQAAKAEPFKLKGEPKVA